MAGVFALTLALGASVAWGSADFLAGASCRRMALPAVLFVSQAFGLALMVPLAFALGGPPPGASFLLLGVLAGALNAVALAALYRGLAVGNMGIVAPIAATDAVIPLTFGVLTGDHLGGLAAAGIALALVGVVLASHPGAAESIAARGEDRSKSTGVALALIAAVCFGGFVVALDGASAGGVFWAVAISRLSSTVLIGAAVLYRRSSVAIGRADAAPLLAVGTLDVAASALFAAATTAGMLGVVGVVGSLYPVITVVMAGVLLGERPGDIQRLGTVGALAGVALIAA
jgi:drug/metabolite transporter (DMT)-like permease